jgi:hypothetical protein
VCVRNNKGLPYFVEGTVHVANAKASSNTTTSKVPCTFIFVFVCLL